MGQERPDHADRPDESEAQRADRNFMELLQGLRVAVTGVQVLFAFLLTVPFSQGFASAGPLDRKLFYVALVTAALASLFFIAPVAQHRILFHRGMKRYLVRRSNLYGLIGTVSLAVSITSATLMVVDHLFDGPLPLITAAAIMLAASWLWFVEPMVNRRNDGPSTESNKTGGPDRS
ncbi:DUF6328 family protein [Actinocorallia lasiicapitis]